MPVYNYFDEDSMEFLTKLLTGQIYIFAEETTPVRPMHAYITTKATVPISIVVR